MLVLLGAVEMYNLDHSPMLTALTPETTRNPGPLFPAYGAGLEDAVSCIYESTGDLTREKDPISLFRCKIHGPHPPESKTPGFANFVWKRMESLMAQGASINERDPEGNTAVHLAVEAENMLLIGKILAKNPDLSARNAEGKTPLDLALTKGLGEIAAFLKSKGGVGKIKPVMFGKEVCYLIEKSEGKPSAADGKTVPLETGQVLKGKPAFLTGAGGKLVVRIFPSDLLPDYGNDQRQVTKEILEGCPTLNEEDRQWLAGIMDGNPMTTKVIIHPDSRISFADPVFDEALGLLTGLVGHLESGEVTILPGGPNPLPLSLDVGPYRASRFFGECKGIIRDNGASGEIVIRAGKAMIEERGSPAPPTELTAFYKLPFANGQPRSRGLADIKRYSWEMLIRLPQEKIHGRSVNSCP